MKKHKILLVDDNENFLDLFLALPEWDDFDAIPVGSGQTALRLLDREPFNLIVSDIQMPGMNGIELFRKVQQRHPEIPVILLTAYGTVNEAMAAVKQGAFHYFEKPLDDHLPLFWTTVREALAKGAMQDEIALLEKEKAFGRKADAPLLGQSKEFMAIRNAIAEVAMLPVTVLITGETGTGKGLVARNIHDAGSFKEGPFLAVSCTEFSPGLLESELFGHEKGAFTGARGPRRGLFEVANQGTLFLDEIGDAPPALQAKLLRVLESGEFKRVGGERTLKSVFRLIAATNQDLDAAVADGGFRKDLLFRIKVYEIPLPSLRQRRQDIPLIAEFYRKRFASTYDRPISGIDPKAEAALVHYDWPGNIRELINVIERAVITCREPVITKAHLPFDDAVIQGATDLDLRGIERRAVETALARTRGNKTQAAGLLGISRKAMGDKVRRFGIEDNGPAVALRAVTGRRRADD